MNVVLNYNLLFYLSSIIVFCVIPVYLYRRNWKETAIIAGLITYFFILNRSMLGNNEQYGVLHDTKMSYEYLLTLLKQWLDGNVHIGWNPYMNGGEPFYLFSNWILWTPWVVFCWLNKIINLSNHLLFTMFWLFLFVNFCVGSFLLFYALYDNFKAALFSFVVLMFSGMFIASLTQPTGLTVIYYLPFILFGVISSWKTNNIYGIALAVIFFGILANHYIPHYFLLCFAVFIILALMFNLKQISSKFNPRIYHFTIIFLAFILSLLAALPVFFAFKETRNYISPTRGNTLGGIIKDSDFGGQPGLNASLDGYKILLTDSRIGEMVGGGTHHAFYLGAIPLLMIPFAFFLKEKKKFFLTCLSSTLLIVYLGTSGGYGFITQYLPGYNMLRHTFGLAQFAAFFLICVIGYGCLAFLTDDIFNIIWLKYLILVLYAVFLLIAPTLIVFLFGGIFLIVVFLVNNNYDFFGKKIIAKNIYLIVMTLLMINLSYKYRIESHDEIRNYAKGVRVQYHPNFVDLTYPMKRTLYPRHSYIIPFDISPVIYKEASLTHKKDDYLFFRAARLHDMLQLYKPRSNYEAALGVNAPIFYFTRRMEVFPESTPKEQIINSIYHDVKLNPSPSQRIVFFLENEINFPRKEIKNIPLEKGLIRYEHSTNPNEFELIMEAPEEGFLVRLENYHSGWQAFLDGEETQIYRANYAFQAIKVPQGYHRIRFQFKTIYPYLFYCHIGVVFCGWFFYNIYLMYLRNHQGAGEPGLVSS